MYVEYTKTEPLLLAGTTVAAASGRNNPSGMKTYQASGTTSAGAGAATIAIQGSNDGGTNWDTIDTISLTLATVTSSSSFASMDRYGLIRANVTAISGTGASVSVNVGY